jgi:xanthine dehydrogenase accessory factor
MRELDLILQQLAAAAERGEGVMLATVMRVEGSVYRGTGARMLVLASGESVGAVSGGCLEADVIARAAELLASGQPELVSYDTRSSDDAVLGLGLGCQGIIELLLEPLAGPALDEAVALYARLAHHREPVRLLTRVRADPRNGRSSGRIGERAITAMDGRVLEGSAAVAGDPESASEVIQPAVQLLICGAGSDAIPLARLASMIGFHVSVVDHRGSFVTPSRFPGAISLHKVDPATEHEKLFDAAVPLDRRTMAVVMAHSASHDRAYLHALLRTGVRYIGVLGPRRRTLELLGDGVAPARALPGNVYSPVGLDLGAETPEEIALAIVAEIAAVASGRAGGMLRDRPGPIHTDRSPGVNSPGAPGVQ